MVKENALINVSFDYRGESQHLKFEQPAPCTKFVVYSADFGGYSGSENIVKSALNCPDLQFIFFTDSVLFSCPSNLLVCPVEDKTSDKRLAAKYFKINSNYTLGGLVESSLWIDSNMVLKKGFSVDDLGLEKADIALFKHDKRDKISAELNEVRKFAKDTDEALNYFINNIRKEEVNYDRLGLFQGRFLSRRKNEMVSFFEGIWWSYILGFSIRDQLTLPLAVNKSKVNLFNLKPNLSSDSYEVVHHLRYDFSAKKSSFRMFVRYLKGLFMYKLSFFIKRG